MQLNRGPIPVAVKYSFENDHFEIHRVEEMMHATNARHILIITRDEVIARKSKRVHLDKVLYDAMIELLTRVDAGMVNRKDVDLGSFGCRVSNRPGMSESNTSILPLPPDLQAQCEAVRRHVEDMKQRTADKIEMQRARWDEIEAEVARIAIRKRRFQIVGGLFWLLVGIVGLFVWTSGWLQTLSIITVLTSLQNLFDSKLKKRKVFGVQADLLVGYFLSLAIGGYLITMWLGRSWIGVACGVVIIVGAGLAAILKHVVLPRIRRRMSQKEPRP